MTAPAPPLPARPRWAFAAVWAAAAVVAAGLTLAAAAFPLRAALAGLCAAAAAGWAWRTLPAGPGRVWAAAVPVGAWVIGAGGWPGAAAVAGAGLCGLLWARPGARVRRESPMGRERPPAEPAEPSADQSFTRTTTPARDAAAGALRVPCVGGGGEGHVLFWPPFAGVPAVACFPEDGVGRVRAACVLPHGVRFEVVRPAGAGDARVCFEAELAAGP